MTALQCTRIQWSKPPTANRCQNPCLLSYRCSSQGCITGSRHAVLQPAKAGEGQGPQSTGHRGGPVESHDTDAQASSSTQESMKRRQDAAESVERAAKMLGEIVEEITSTLYIEEAAAYLQDTGTDLSEDDAIKQAVLARIEFLDANFLLALNGYIQATAKAGNDMAELLVRIREEVLRQITSRLPSSARVLDRALQLPAKDQRMALLRKALSGGSGDIPGAEIGSLSATASQFIEDIEDQEVIADRRLLARLCILKEELRSLQLEDGFFDPNAPGDVTRSNVPQRSIAFLKELLNVSDPLKRVGLLDKALSEDWEGAAPRGKPQKAELAGQPDFVRPGRLLSTLQSMLRELELQGASVDPRIVQRLSEIQAETLAVLDRMQQPTST